MFTEKPIAETEADFAGFTVSEDTKTVNAIMEYAREFTSNVAKNLTTENIQEWMEIDDDAPTVHELSTEEIVQMVTQPDASREESEDENGDDDDSINPTEKISLDRTIELTELLIAALEQRTFISEQEIMQVYNLQAKLIKEKPNYMKQLKIQDLFKKVGDRPTAPGAGITSHPTSSLDNPIAGPSSAPLMTSTPEPGLAAAPDTPNPVTPEPGSTPDVTPPESPDITLPSAVTSDDNSTM